MINVGDILSIVRDTLSTVGRYHLSLFEYLHGAEHPHGNHDIPVRY